MGIGSGILVQLCLKRRVFSYAHSPINIYYILIRSLKREVPFKLLVINDI
jgi:hypothetical protein